MSILPRGVSYEDEVPVRIDRRLDRGNLPEVITKEARRIARDTYEHISSVDVFLGKDDRLLMKFHRCCSGSRDFFSPEFYREFRIAKNGFRYRLEEIPFAYSPSPFLPKRA